MANFLFLRNNLELTVKENTQLSYRTGDEKRALKQAKEAELAFRKSKGLDTDPTLIQSIKKLFKE